MQKTPGVATPAESSPAPLRSAIPYTLPAGPAAMNTQARYSTQQYRGTVVQSTERCPW